MRDVLRPLACLLLVMAAVLGLPTAAQAAVRSGSATDPVGEATDPAYDLAGVVAGYDEAGTLSVTATFAQPLPAAAGGPSLSATFTDDVGACSLQTTTFAGLTGGVGASDSVVLVTPVDDDVTSSRALSADRRSLTFTGSGPGLAAKDLRCVSVAIGTSPAPIDVLDAPLGLQGESGLPFPPPVAPTTAPAPGVVVPSTPSPTAAAPVRLTLASSTRGGRVRTVLPRGLSVRPGCSQACRVGIDVTIPLALARRVGLATRRDRRTHVVVASAKASASGATDVVIARFGAKARRVLARQRRLDLRVEVRASADGVKLTRVVRARLTR